MTRITEKAVFTALIFAFSAVILYLTFDLRTDVGLVPRSVAVLLLICSAVQLLIDLFPAFKKRMAFLAGSAEGSVGGEGVVQEQEEGGESVLKRLLFFGWIGMFIALIGLTSMLLAAPISLFVYLKLISRESWRMSLLYALGMGLFIYLVFVRGFGLAYFM